MIAYRFLAEILSWLSIVRMGRALVRWGFSVRSRAKFRIPITLSGQIVPIWPDRDLCARRAGEGSLSQQRIGVEIIARCTKEPSSGLSATFSHATRGRRGTRKKPQKLKCDSPARKGKAELRESNGVRKDRVERIKDMKPFTFRMVFLSAT